MRRPRGPAEPERETLYGVNPVLEALAARRRSIERLLVSREAHGDRVGRALREARAAGIPIRHLSRSVLSRQLKTSAHQGIAAIVSAAPYVDAEDLLRRAGRHGDALLVMLDGVTDPRNVGAAIRSAAAAGCHGVLLHAERTAGLTPAAAKTSAGALEHIPVARTSRPRALAEALQAAGFRVLALDPRGAVSWSAADYSGRILLVAGGEQRGPGRWVRDLGAVGVAVPLAGAVESLNVSVALGVVLFEAVRQRGGG